MASLIDISGLTLNTEEAKEIGKLIIEKAFVQGELAEIHDIETGVHYDMQIPFAGQIADSLKASSGCTPNTGSGVVMTEKVWEPKIYDSRWEHCAADLNKLFKLFQKAQRINPDFYNRIDSQEMGVIYALIEQMLRTNLPVKVWFSDTAADLASGSGVFTAGTDLDLYNVIDGLFKQIFADANIPRVTISENGSASYALQDSEFSDEDAYNVLKNMVNIADARLLMDPGAKFLVTRSISDRYKNHLREKTLGNGFLEVTENGKTRLYFDGYEVVTMHEWDRTIRAAQDNGTTYNLPHRAVFTTPENIPVATVSTDDLSTLDSFYDQYRKSNIIDVAFSLDAKLLESYMAVAAY